MCQSGAGIYYGPGHHYNRSYRVAGDKQTSQRGEIAAIYHLARQQLYLPAPLHIHTDSKTVILGLTMKLEERSATGFMGVTNGDYYAAAASWLAESKKPANDYPVGRGTQQ